MINRQPMEDAGNLLHQLKSGDPEAVRAFVNEYAPRIHGFIRCLIYSNETAEDLTQEVLLKAFRKCRQVRNPEQFHSWLFTIARNAALKEMAHKRYRVESSVDQRFLDELAAGSGNAGMEKISREQCAILLAEALSTLDEKRREIMALRYYSGLPLKAIARVTGLPLGSIGTTITRSLESLRGYFDSRGISFDDLI